MTLATDNVGNRRQMYIINCMNVPKYPQLDQKNEKLLLWCAHVTRWCGGWTSSLESFISDLRNAPKQLRKTVTSWAIYASTTRWKQTPRHGEENAFKLPFRSSFWSAVWNSRVCLKPHAGDFMCLWGAINHKAKKPQVTSSLELTKPLTLLQLKPEMYTAMFGTDRSL